jgi:aldose 1-epimerase
MLSLSRDGDSLVVASEHGGAIVGWTRRGMHLLRRPSPAAVLLGYPGAMGCFPLVPYCNRIAFHRFNWAGQAYELAANFGDHPHAIHGVGWQKPWVTEEVSADCVTLSLRHDATGEAARAWPFAFAARLTYRLTGEGLTIRIEATNLHSTPAPMGIGAHPYFPRAAGAIIEFQANGVWMNRDALAVTHQPIPAEWDHSAGRSADREPLDNCFTGWHGETQLPGMRIKADPVMRDLQVFTPAGADFFCVEPVSHAPDAINRPEERGMTVLVPGQTIAASMTFSPVDGALAAGHRSGTLCV